MIAPTGGQPGQEASRDESGGAELLRRVRSRVDAEVRRLERELSAYEDEWPRPPSGPRQRFAAGRDRLSTEALAAYAPTATAASARLDLMRQLERALAGIGPGDLCDEWAGPGSIVSLEEIASGERFEYMLMPGEVADVAAGHVSLASPIGQAVQGRGVGATVEVRLPAGTRTFRIRSLTTLPVLVGATARDQDRAARPRRGTGETSRERGRGETRRERRP